MRERNEDPDSDDSSSEEEDEDGRLLTSSVNLKFLKLMKALRKKDDAMYDKSTRFFDEESDEIEEKGEKKEKVKKVKDVLREQILEQMDEDGADKSAAREPAQSKLAYDAQQEEIRKSFLKSAGGNDDDESDDDKEDWMVIKTRKEPSLEEKEALAHFEEIEEITKKQSDNYKTVDPRGEVKDGDKFLLDFLKQKKWIDKDGDFGADDDSIDDLDNADHFEASYNFRFEQAEAEAASSGATLSVQTYARGNTMTTVRRTDTTRKEKREARRERKAAERRAKEEQLKRLKNAKQQEANNKLAQIKSVLGSVDQETVDEVAIMKMLEGDYDPEQFEKAMNAAYGDEFYEKEDQDWKTDLDVREGLKGDEDGEAIVGDDVEGGMYDTQGVEEEEEEENDDAEGDRQDWGDDEEVAEGEEDATPETELEKNVKKKMQEELYKLDYEDIVAGMPTRFKYRQVEENDYGLSTHEVLLARDSNLKQFVSLKKMAPYNEDGEHNVGSKKRRRFREALKNDMEEYKAQEQAAMAEKETAEQNERESGEEPKKKKRRRLKKGKKRDSESTPAETAEKKEPKIAPEKESTKKRRKKKGKKGESSDSSPQDDSGKTEESMDHVPIESIADEKNIKTPGSSESKKKRKKKKKKEKLGLSASRLSSYGL